MREIRLTVRGDTVHANRHRAGVQGEANAAALEVSFDESWDGYAKTITFWDAYGENPVVRTLTVDLLVDAANDTRTYQTTIPGEPLALAGECVLVIDGYKDGARARSMSVRLTVEEAPVAENAGEPADPTPTQAEQLQVQIEAIMGDIQKAAQAAGSAERAERAAENAENYAVHQPVVGENGNWWLWNGEEYVDTGKPSQGGDGPKGEPGTPGPAGKQGPQGPEGVGVVKYAFDPEIWRWVMRYTDDHINTYPGFSPHDRDKFVVWRDTFEPGRENADYSVGEDALYENAKMFYQISSAFHAAGVRYGIEQVDGQYAAKLTCAGTGSYDYNKMVTKCHSWGSYTAQVDFNIKTPPTGAKTAGLIFNLFEGYTFGTGTILAYINGGGNAYITDNTSGSAVQAYMLNSSGSRIKVACDTWYTARLTCAVGAVSMSVWPKDQSEADGWLVECRSGSITAEVIEAQKGLRIQTRPSKVTELTNTVYVGNLSMWESYLSDEKYVLVESITTTEAVNVIQRTVEPSGMPYNFKRVRVHIDCPVTNGSAGVYIRDSKDVLCYIQSASSSSAERWSQAVVDVSRGYNESLCASTAGNKGTLASAYIPGMLYFRSVSVIDRIDLSLSSSTVVFPIGTKIDIYGVRA